MRTTRCLELAASLETCNLLLCSCLLITTTTIIGTAVGTALLKTGSELVFYALAGTGAGVAMSSAMMLYRNRYPLWQALKATYCPQGQEVPTDGLEVTLITLER